MSAAAKVSRFFSTVFQIFIVGILLITLTALAFDFRKTQLVGAPTILFWVTIGAFLVLALINAPPVFFRIPKHRSWARLALIPLIVMFFVYTNVMGGFYERTPQGIEEAQLAEQEALAEAEGQRQAAIVRAAQESYNAQNPVEDASSHTGSRHSSVEDCVGWRGQIPALVEATRSSLHNPRAFEHVETVVMAGPGYNARMTFRAENGFGAIRTTSRGAEIDPNSCSVISLGPVSD